RPRVEPDAVGSGPDPGVLATTRSSRPRARVYAGHPRLSCRASMLQDVDGPDKPGHGELSRRSRHAIRPMTELLSNPAQRWRLRQIVLLWPKSVLAWVLLLGSG